MSGALNLPLSQPQPHATNEHAVYTSLETTPSCMNPERFQRNTHCIRHSDIDSDALKVLRRLHQAGFQARLVGGGVRDLLLHKQPKDFDIATDARPNQVRSLFSNSRIIGRRFKLVHVYFGRGKIFELATFRAESQADDTQMLSADNTYGSEETDAIRRDLTINGLFYDPISESIIDYVGGMQDLENKVIRVIGDPAVRFNEDPVRMLRVIRHAVRSRFTVEENTLNALKENVSLINHCAPVRLYEEFKKDVSSGYASGILELLDDTGLLPVLLPELSAEFLKKDSVMKQVLYSLDAHSRIGNEIPMQIFFCALALCQFTSAPHHYQSYPLSDNESIKAAVAELFTAMAVPRRIRENMEITLSLWNTAMGTTGDLKDIVNRKEARHVDFAFMLHKLLPKGSFDVDLYRKLRALREHALLPESRSFPHDKVRGALLRKKRVPRRGSPQKGNRRSRKPGS